MSNREELPEQYRAAEGFAALWRRIQTAEGRVAVLTEELRVAKQATDSVQLLMESDVAVLTEERDEWEREVGLAHAKVDALLIRAGGAEDRAERAEARVEVLTEERDALRAVLNRVADFSWDVSVRDFAVAALRDFPELGGVPATKEEQT